MALPLALAGSTSHINGSNNEVKGKVGRGGSRTALALAGPTSHINGGNNEVEGKVGGGGDCQSRMALALAGPTSLQWQQQ